MGATIGVDGNGQIKHTGGSFSGSGTPQYEYGAEAARTTWRVALDAAFYPEKSSEWSPYLSQYNYRMDNSFNGGSSRRIPSHHARDRERTKILECLAIGRTMHL